MRTQYLNVERCARLRATEQQRAFPRYSFPKLRVRVGRVSIGVRILCRPKEEIIQSRLPANRILYRQLNAGV